MRKIKETEEGKKYEWIDCGSGAGFWSIIEDEDIKQTRQPMSCPACNKLLFNWDSSFFNRWGVCANDYHDWIEGRNNLPDFKNDNSLRAAYIKEKIAEKHNRE